MIFRIPGSSASIALNMWNPLYALAPFSLLIFSIPLAIFATATTSVAMALLLLRASVVYVQLTAALVGAWINPPSPPAPVTPSTSSPTSQRHVRSTNLSAASSQESMVPPARASHRPDRSASFANLIGASDMTRDFEGVGGWRVAGDDDEEALWMGLNSRFQIPPESVERRHHRSHTGGPVPGHRGTWSPETFRLSPVQSRARTPVRFVLDEDDDYFPPQSSLRPSSTFSDSNKHHGKSRSWNASGSSNTVHGVTAAAKEAGT